MNSHDVGLPEMDPFNLLNPSYLAFTEQGAFVVDDFLLSLNDVMERAYPLDQSSAAGVAAKAAAIAFAAVLAFML